MLFTPPHHIDQPLKSQSDTAGSSDTVGSVEDSSPDDPFNVDSDDGGGNTEDEDLRRNTLQNSGFSHVQPLGRQKAPLNPFDRTAALANAENGRATRTSAAEPKTRPQYSVDEFKNLLLTGNKSTSETTAPPIPPASIHALQASGDTSSNTDASSISRQSIFEPPPEVRQDTPRTSHELSSSDEERWQLVRSPQSAKESRKPATPQSHHGKPMVENISQKGLYKEPSSPIASSGASDVSVGRSLSGSPRTPTNLNKPLPPPPTLEASDHNVPNQLQSLAQPKPDPPPVSPNRKREPPAPPSARRQGQARPKSLLGDTGRSIPMSEGKLPDPPQITSVFPTQQPFPSDSSAKPPPPPPRRPGPIRGLSTSSTTSGVSMVPTPSSSNFSDESSSNTPKSRPPVPPTRNRSSSSLKRQMTLPAQTGITGLPPAPPPRRRGSSQSSLSPTCLSGEYQPSFAERQRTDSGASSIQSKDVMADLSALQKEVDALRGKFGT